MQKFPKFLHDLFYSGEVEDGFPPFGLPPFTTVSHNETLNFEDMASKFGTSLLSVPFISILETIAIAKSFCEYFCLHIVCLSGKLIQSFSCDMLNAALKTFLTSKNVPTVGSVCTFDTSDPTNMLNCV